MTKRTLTLSSMALFASLALADNQQGVFDLTKNGTQVCKTRPGRSAQTCYQVFNEKLGALELVDRAKALKTAEDDGYSNLTAPSSELLDKAGGALLLTRKNRDLVLANFTRISVRNIAIDAKTINAVGDSAKVIPFYATIYWQGTNGMQGTVYVDGVFNAANLSQANAADADMDSAIERLNQAFDDSFSIDGISDSTTELKIEDLRRLERLSRTVQFRSIYGDNSDPDADTVQFLKEIVGPAVVADIIYIPLIQSLLHLTVSFGGKN